MHKIRNRLFFLIFIFSAHCSYAKIRLVLTTALTDTFFEVRKEQYINSFKILSTLGYNDFYIIEGFKFSSPTFLNDYCQNVFYASAQDLSFPPRHNGINEAKTLLEGLNHFNFDPDDMIIKLTGRYQFVSDYFLKIIQKYETADALMKFNVQDRPLTLCFAMKYKHLKTMLESIDYKEMERRGSDLETEVKNWVVPRIKRRELNVIQMDKVQVKAMLYGTSTCPTYNSPEYIGKELYF